MSEKFAGTCQIASPLTLTDQSWYLDSRATDHIVADGDSLVEQVEYKGSNKLMVGNGQHLSITHIGNISIFTDICKVKLLDVLVVPKIAKNLLSVSKLTKDNNIFVEFNAAYCVLKNQQGNQLLKGINAGGLYKMLLPSHSSALLPPLQASFQAQSFSGDSSMQSASQTLSLPVITTASSIKNTVSIEDSLCNPVMSSSVMLTPHNVIKCNLVPFDCNKFQTSKSSCNTSNFPLVKMI